jgi:hypothetical protein
MIGLHKCQYRTSNIKIQILVDAQAQQWVRPPIM